MYALPLLLLLGAVIYWKRVLDARGTLIAVFMGVVVYLSGGYSWLLLLLSFLFLGFATTKYRFSYKRFMGVCEASGGCRGSANVIANGAVPVLFALLNMAHESVLFAAGYIASVASVTADTLSSELGVLSRQRPVLITNFKPVKPGTDGGVTPLGEAAGVAGALLVALLGGAAGVAPLSVSLAAGVAGGIIGFNVDSLLGATLERRRVLENAGVNLLSSFAGGMVGSAAALVLLR